MRKLIHEFPDVEKELVSGLKTLLINNGETNFRVATKRDSSNNTQIICRFDGGNISNHLLDGGFTIYIWVNRDSESEAYAEANRISLKISSLVEALPLVSKFKFVSHGNVSPVEDEGLTQVRSIISDCLVPGTINYLEF